MRRNKTTKAIALLMSMTMITSVFVSNTLSRYVTSVSSTDNARVAVWGINAGQDTVMNLFSEDYIVAGKTIAASNTNGEKIMAPGTAGEAEFEIINFEQDVAPEVAYEVKISLDDSEIHEKIKNNPSVQWKLDGGIFGTWDQLKTSILSLAGNETGSHKYGPGEFATAFQGTQTHKIAWQWVMDNSNNVMDTEMGNLALTNDLKAVIKVSITAQQIDDLITNSNMLSGINQVINADNVQSAVFKSVAPRSELIEVRINDATVDPSNYEAREGSTIITLHKDYLETLEIGSYVIEIVSQNATAATSFKIVDDPSIHNKKIPEGGTYYIGVTSECPDVGDYEGATEILTANQAFPGELTTGDVYIYGDYEYRYNMSYDDVMGGWFADSSQNGWGVMVIDRSKTKYGEVLNAINNKDIVSMRFTFMYCTSLIEAPAIPYSVTDIEAIFYDCESLTTAPVIPDYVTHAMNAFAGCSNLTGTVQFDANPTNYYGIFSGTEKPIKITGWSHLLDEIAADYDNVTVQ